MTKAYVITNHLEIWDAIPAAPAKLLALTEARKAVAQASAASGAPVDPTALRQAVSFLEPDVSYPIWRDYVAGIGAANCPQAREIAHEFSEGKLDRLERYGDARPGNYSGPEAVDTVLDTMPPKEGGVGVGTIDKAARDAGWPGTLAPRPSASETFKGFIEQQSDAPRPNLFSTRQHDKHQKPPRWLVEGIIAENTDVALVAPSKFLKSFLATHLACHVATGKRWGNRAVAGPAAVFYCAAEGAHSLKTHRVTAWEIAHGDGAYTAERMHVSSTAPTLGSDSAAAFIEDARAQMQPGEKAGLFIVDTMNRALNGADEDKSSTASAYFNMLAPIRAALGCSTLTVHHMGKDVDKGPRGSSAFFAGFDTVLIIEKAAKDEATGSYFLTVRVDKQKDGEDGQEFILHARKVETPNGDSLALFPAAEDDLKRATGRQVGLRRADVAAALAAMGACPDGANEWTGTAGGIPTRQLAAEIARARLAADGAGLEPTAKEIDALVTILNRGAQDGGPFDAYVVRSKPRQWAVAPGPINAGGDHV